jgi:hypothetical protein
LISSLALTDVGDAAAKLSLTAKQELTIDPRIFGIQAKDELVLSHLASIPTFITTFNWPISSVTDNILWNTYVTPKVVRTASTKLYIPACTFAALPFKYWRGTMRYRFQIVASAFHKGRLRFVYDPGYVEGLESNVSITRIVDLANERDFTIDVAWGNENHYLEHNPVDQTNYNTAAIVTAQRNFTNGVLGVYVLNGLTAPSSLVNNDISINVFVSMCDDAEFAVPDDSGIANITFAPLTGGPMSIVAPIDVEQLANVDEPDRIRRAESEYFPDLESLTKQDDASDMEPDSNKPSQVESTETVMKCLPADDNTTDVYFGERVTSFRQVMKRYTYLSSYLCTATELTPGACWLLSQKNFPMYRGENFAANTQKVGAIGYNFAKTTLINYVTPAFTGVRGSQRSKYTFHTDVPMLNNIATVTRNNSSITVGNSGLLASGTNTSAYSKLEQDSTDSGISGSYAIQLAQNPTLEVEFPYFTNRRFDAARSLTLISANSPDATHTIKANFRRSSATGIGGAHRYVSTGEDFQLFLFQGMPPFYKRATPAPV